MKCRNTETPYRMHVLTRGSSPGPTGPRETRTKTGRVVTLRVCAPPAAHPHPPGGQGWNVSRTVANRKCEGACVRMRVSDSDLLSPCARTVVFTFQNTYRLCRTDCRWRIFCDVRARSPAG